jgi:effector-binding domain-containing protein/uncharacterized protein YndB with AHSA1/START domain
MTKGLKLAAAPGAIAMGVVLVGLLLPDRVRVDDRIVIDAPRSTVFALLNDFNRVEDWWTRRFAADPTTRVRIAGPGSGAGASIRWSSKILGNGRETIVASERYRRIETRLELDGHADGRIVYELSAADDGHTQVDWTFEQPVGLDIGARYYGLLLDDIVGRQYAEGLAQLAVHAESLPPFDFSDLEVEHIVVESTDIAYVPTTSEPLARAAAQALGDAYLRLLDFIDTNDLSTTGSRISISRARDGRELRFDAGVPVRGLKSTPPIEKEQVRLGKSYGGAVIRVRHEGALMTLSETHEKIAAYLAANGIRRNGDAWEAYVSDRSSAKPGELVTYVYYPVVARGE